MKHIDRPWLAATVVAMVVLFVFHDTARGQVGWVMRATWFDPDTHGWSFQNDAFKVCAAPTCQGENGMGDVLTFRWALCGGMSLSALRRFMEGRSVEDFSASVKEELVRAQIETVQLSWEKSRTTRTRL